MTTTENCNGVGRMRGLYYDVELRILVSDSIDRIANCYDEGLIVSNYFFPMQQCQILTGSNTKENKLPAIVIINNPSRFFFFFKPSGHMFADSNISNARFSFFFPSLLLRRVIRFWTSLWAGNHQ